MNVIQTHGLTKSYRGTLAVDRLSFEVRPGTVTGFLGPNGAGKSTTMRMIIGLDRPDTGSALIGGKPYADLRWPLREVGAMVETKSFQPGRSARAHLAALAVSNKIPRRRVEDMLAVTGLTQVADKRAGKFSLGMAQRLGVAAALLGDPGVLILDEPVNGLDPEGIRWIRDLMKSLAEQGRTVFVSSHLISEVALAADDLVVIGQGRLLAQTTVAALSAGHASAQRAGLASLTPRERQVLSAMAEGRSNAGIASALVLSEGAVEKHIASIFGKLNLEPIAGDNRRVLCCAALSPAARGVVHGNRGPDGTSLRRGR